MSLQSRRNTTLGLDVLPYILIKKLDESIQNIFLKILKSLWLKKIALYNGEHNVLSLF